MNTDSFREWLERYEQAWEGRDPEAAAGLFTVDATYQGIPSSEPMRGREAIRAYWAEVPQTQERVEFRSELVRVTEGLGVAQWHASFIRVTTRVRVELDGVFIVRLNESGECTEFNEWWHRQEQGPISA